MINIYISFQQIIDKLLLNSDWNWERDKEKWMKITQYMHEIDIFIDTNIDSKERMLRYQHLDKIRDMPISSFDGVITTFGIAIESPDVNPMLKASFPSIAKNMLDRCFIEIKKFLKHLNASSMFKTFGMLNSSDGEIAQLQIKRLQLANLQLLSTALIDLIDKNIKNIKNKQKVGESAEGIFQTEAWGTFVDCYKEIDNELNCIADEAKSKPLWLHIMLSDFNKISNMILFFIGSKSFKFTEMFHCKMLDSKYVYITKNIKQFITILKMLSYWGLNVKQSSFVLDETDIPLKLVIHNDYIQKLASNIKQINVMIGKFFNSNYKQQKMDCFTNITTITVETWKLLTRRMDFDDVKQNKFITAHLLVLYNNFNCLQNIKLMSDISSIQHSNGICDIDTLKKENILCYFKSVFYWHKNLIDIEINNN